MTMREKMARAIYNSRVSPPVSDGHWAAIKDECMERFEGSAVDAALDALMDGIQDDAQFRAKIRAIKDER